MHRPGPLHDAQPAVDGHAAQQDGELDRRHPAGDAEVERAPAAGRPATVSSSSGSTAGRRPDRTQPATSAPPPGEPRVQPAVAGSSRTSSCSTMPLRGRARRHVVARARLRRRQRRGSGVEQERRRCRAGGSVPAVMSTSTFGRPSCARRARSEPTVRPSRSVLDLDDRRPEPRRGDEVRADGERVRVAGALERRRGDRLEQPAAVQDAGAVRPGVVELQLASGGGRSVAGAVTPSEPTEAADARTGTTRLPRLGR